MMELNYFDLIELLGELKSLKSRIAELEAENIRLGIEYQRMRLALGNIAINSKRALKESPTDHLTARWRQERQDDKSPNDTQTDTFVYGKDSKPIPGPFCGEIVKECNDVATPIDVALRKRIAELEGKIDQLTAHSDIERQDDKCSKPEPNVCEACGGDGTVLLTDGYKGQVIATAKCIYCNGTGRVNKERDE